MTIGNIKNDCILLIYILKCTLFTKAHAAFGQGICYLLEWHLFRELWPFKNFSPLKLSARLSWKVFELGLGSLSVAKTEMISKLID